MLSNPVNSNPVNSTPPPFTAVTNLREFPEGTMKMVRIGTHRVCLVHLSSGVYAIDNACPHEGYGLTQGELIGDQLTCVWHNWKFRVTDGTCTQGEEDVETHVVQVDPDGTVSVALKASDPSERRPVLLQSLRHGIERDYVGQISRDVVRLLKASANPGELVWEAVAFGAPRAEYGWGHSIASATDCLSIANCRAGDDRALPIVQAIAGVSESERGRPREPLPEPRSSLPPDAQQQFGAAIEEEKLADAQALVRTAIHEGCDADELSSWFRAAICRHHLSYGHGAIYTQKAFELLAMIGWDRADTVLPYLVPSIVYGTREDKLPYMRPFMKQLARTDINGLAAIPTRDFDGGETLVAALLGNNRTYALDSTIHALNGGAGVDGILDACIIASSERLLRYDVAGERDFLDDFNWLDITHGLTYAHAARWHHHESCKDGIAEPQVVRLALFCTFLAFWTGRHEWHTSIGARHTPQRLANTTHTYGELLQEHALLDPAASFIHQAHVVKTSRAAALEANRLRSDVPLLAAQRFLEAPKQQRFVAATVARSVEFVNGRQPHGEE